MALHLTRYRLAMVFYGVIAPGILIGFAAFISDSPADFQGLVLAGGVISVAGLDFIVTSRSDARTLATAVRDPDPDEDPRPPSERRCRWRDSPSRPGGVCSWRHSPDTLAERRLPTGTVPDPRWRLRV